MTPRLLPHLPHPEVHQVPALPLPQGLVLLLPQWPVLPLPPLHPVSLPPLWRLRRLVRQPQTGLPRREERRTLPANLCVDWW
jgi:hypothetical protein